ncbi:hypothetical protein CON65_22270 [Bacillus pseudomycoides]|uniref:Uncharacterized protein n=1 Tax=Bacillus pseudomycoides TaxID=64104 RepID=A0AA91ZRD6_9BACI|nr:MULTISPECIES: hypothetical protein [Bacillus]PEB47698.1 hypothetical protein COO03_25430 [Bacillus sp. AFS098217]PED80531.1 hypothetical protein CON65_22270 [Bacillus pseudomycoides]PEU10881.1 hypothetical protein CN525_23120 [Bacillus sp. AFS014408]PEU18101.1 hypothetical protein CN524_00335 [Bacillus sp. AFS019443]PFW61642.1 hypothetical protein COL20_16495 [Bacillus sp. AFS075034]
MKRKLVLSIIFSGALALSIGFAKDFQSTKVVAQTNGDQYKLVTKEEQVQRESTVAEGKDVTTVITVEEQDMVENSSAQEGFVPQANGTGFYFEKSPKN